MKVLRRIKQYKRRGMDIKIKGGEAATSPLNLEPNESKLKRGCEEMRIYFFTAPLVIMDFSVSLFTGDGIPPHLA